MIYAFSCESVSALHRINRVAAFFFYLCEGVRAAKICTSRDKPYGTDILRIWQQRSARRVACFLASRAIRLFPILVKDADLNAFRVSGSPWGRSWGFASPVTKAVHQESNRLQSRTGWIIYISFPWYNNVCAERNLIYSCNKYPFGLN